MWHYYEIGEVVVLSQVTKPEHRLVMEVTLQSEARQFWESHWSLCQDVALDNTNKAKLAQGQILHVPHVSKQLANFLESCDNFRREAFQHCRPLPREVCQVSVAHDLFESDRLEILFETICNYLQLFEII